MPLHPRKSRSSSTHDEFNKSSSSLRRISFSVPSIHNMDVEAQKPIFDCCDDTINTHPARTTVILEVDGNYQAYSDCEENSTPSCNYCSAASPESATRIFNQLSIKKKMQVPRKTQSDSKLDRRERCDYCDLRIIPIGNYTDEDNKDCPNTNLSPALCDDKTTTTSSATTFIVNSSECDLQSNKVKHLQLKKCLNNSSPKTCKAPSAESEFYCELLKSLVKIDFLEEICEQLLERLCTSSEVCESPKNTKKLKPNVDCSCQGKTLQHPNLKPKKKCCHIHKSPPAGALVPKFCVNHSFNNPVDLYHYYNCQWKKFGTKIPSEDVRKRNAVRWLVRGRLFEQEQFGLYNVCK